MEPSQDTPTRSSIAHSPLHDRRFPSNRRHESSDCALSENAHHSRESPQPQAFTSSTSACAILKGASDKAAASISDSKNALDQSANNTYDRFRSAEDARAQNVEGRKAENGGGTSQPTLPARHTYTHEEDVRILKTLLRIRDSRSIFGQKVWEEIASRFSSRKNPITADGLRTRLTKLLLTSKIERYSFSFASALESFL